MYLELVRTLAQGTPLCQVQEGYKDCKNTGNHPAVVFDGKVVCPGCQQMCRVPGNIPAHSCFIVQKRPKQKAS